MLGHAIFANNIPKRSFTLDLHNARVSQLKCKNKNISIIHEHIIN